MGVPGAFWPGRLPKAGPGSLRLMDSDEAVPGDVGRRLPGTKAGVSAIVGLWRRNAAVSTDPVRRRLRAFAERVANNSLARSPAL